MFNQLRVAAVACGLALAAGCAAPLSSYVLPTVGTPQDAAEAPAPVDPSTQTMPGGPLDSTASESDDIMARQP